ncbi:hypothetical protein L1281_001652 [Neisseria sp. HSC-16F19]|nr:hypothetical protein [Neisseria sp. HSC-16F19]MCP2041058.1 hypothetical protein [Neisseria sp. HSC-16F19]
MNKTLTTLLLGTLFGTGVYAAELPFVGFYRDVHTHMITEVYLLPDQRFCHRLHTAPMLLAFSGRWESTAVDQGYRITLQPQARHPGLFVLMTTATDPSADRPKPAARRLSISGESFANLGNNQVLFGWSSRPQTPDNLAPLFAADYRPNIGDVFELDLPHDARHVFLAYGDTTDGYRISRFDSGTQPYLWLALEPGALLRQAPMTAEFRQGRLQMTDIDFGAPQPISAEMQRQLEQDCLHSWPADLPPPVAAETEEFQARLPVKKQPWIKQLNK